MRLLDVTGLLRAFAWARLALAGLLLVTVPFMAEFAPGANTAILGAALLAAVGSSAALLLRRVVPRPRRVAGLLCTLDVVLITSVVAATGGPRSLFPFLYVLSVTAACVLLSRPGAVAIAGAATVLYSGLVFGRTVFPIAYLFEVPGETTVLEVATIFLNAATFLVVAIVAGGVAERYRLTQRELDTRQRDLRDLEAFRDLVFDCVGTGLIVLDRRHRVTGLNRAAAEITGREAAGVTGMSWAGLMGPHLAIEEVAASLEGGPLRREITVGRPDGSQVPVLVTLSALRSAVGERVGIVAACEDLSTLRRMEAQMRQADRLATLGRMSANIAHEIRNPLASLTGAVEALGTGVQDDEREKLTQIVARESDRLNRIIGDFLTYARPAPLEREWTDVASVLEEVLVLLEHRPLPESVKVTRVFAGPLRAEVDASRLRQVVWNLCLNAVEAMPGGGELTVGAGQDATTLTVWIADRGTGIPAGHLADIFEPFFSTKPGGSGLGLALVDRVIRDHGGAVDVRSAPGVGTTVTLTLPVAPDA